MATKTVGIEHEELVSAFIYLDELRESGKTNMYGSSAWLANEFGYDEKKSREIVSMWMRSYDASKQIDERIEDALK